MPLAFDLRGRCFKQGSAYRMPCTLLIDIVKEYDVRVVRAGPEEEP